MSIKIDRNIPLPGRNGNLRKYPFNQMNPGDSFLVEGDSVLRTRNAGVRYGERYGMKFSVRKTPEGFRCWRVS